MKLSDKFFQKACYNIYKLYLFQFVFTPDSYCKIRQISKIYAKNTSNRVTHDIIMLPCQYQKLFNFSCSPCHYSIFINSTQNPPRMHNIMRNILLHLDPKPKPIQNFLKHCNISLTMKIISNNCIPILIQIFLNIS